MTRGLDRHLVHVDYGRGVAARPSELGLTTGSKHGSSLGEMLGSAIMEFGQRRGWTVAAVGA
jgi:hypothetical protein